MFEFKLEEDLEWGRYIGIDEDGKTFLFKDEPVYIEGWWVPDEFRKKMYASCEQLDLDFENFQGRLLKKKRKNKSDYWKFIDG